MNFDLKNGLSAQGADPADIRDVKIALNRLGYYTPASDIGIVAMTDAPLFAAIKKFQTEAKLSVTGSLRPHDDTVLALNRAIEDQPLSEKYIWRTCKDSKTRSSHAARNGKVFS